MARNVPDDILRRLVVGVVARDDAVICVGAGCIRQFLAAHLRAAADRAEHTNQSVRLVGAQRFERAGQRQTVVAVVHDEGAAGQALHHLKATLHRGVGQCGGGLRGCHTEGPTQGNGAQRVRGAERTGGHNPHRGGRAAVRTDKINAERGLTAVLGQIPAVVVSRALDAKADRLALEALAHKGAVGVIGVIDHRAGIVFGKQAALGALVVLKVRVLAGADVVLRQVGEGHYLKGNAVHAVMAQGLTADLQHTVVHTGVQHFAEQAVQLQAFGGGVGGGLVHTGNVHAVGADVGAGQAGLGHNGGGQQGGGGLALGAGNANQMQLIRGVAVEICTDDRQRGAGVLGDDLHGVGGQDQRALDQKGAAAVPVGALRIGVAVQPRADQTDEQRPRPRLAGIVGDSGDVRIGRAGVVNAADKVVQFHRKFPFVTS